MEQTEQSEIQHGRGDHQRDAGGAVRARWSEIDPARPGARPLRRRSRAHTTPLTRRTLCMALVPTTTEAPALPSTTARLQSLLRATGRPGQTPRRRVHRLMRRRGLSTTARAQSPSARRSSARPARRVVGDPMVRERACGNSSLSRQRHAMGGTAERPWHPGSRW